MLRLRVNGRVHALGIPAKTPLLFVLRNDLGLNGLKYGCSLGECDACTIHLDGVAARACILSAASWPGIPARTAPFGFGWKVECRRAGVRLVCRYVPGTGSRVAARVKRPPAGTYIYR